MSEATVVVLPKVSYHKSVSPKSRSSEKATPGKEIKVFDPRALTFLRILAMICVHACLYNPSDKPVWIPIAKGQVPWVPSVITRESMPASWIKLWLYKAVDTSILVNESACQLQVRQMERHTQQYHTPQYHSWKNHNHAIGV